MADVDRVLIDIPDFPSSYNKYMGRGGKKEHIVDYQEEKVMWAWLVRANIKKKPKRPFNKAIVHITYHFDDNRRRDPDNYAGKFILDGLVLAGVIKDDSFDCIDLRLKGVSMCKKRVRLLM